MKYKLALTGPNSMIGRAIQRTIDKNKYEVFPIYHKKYDLTNPDWTRHIFQCIQPDYCIHCAGYNGNIQFNAKFPADIFGTTGLMAINVLGQCANLGVKKVVSLMSSCCYADTPHGMLKEADLWKDLPHDSINGHGLSKRILHAYSLQIKKQYNLNYICVIPNTVFGPYDSFDQNKTKVVGSLIKKFVDAKHNGDKCVVCWGTGTPKRELIYCEDVAGLTIAALEQYENTNLPLNIGYETEVTIRNLAYDIADIIKFDGEIVWDISKPDGQMRKLLDNTRMQQNLVLDKLPYTPYKFALKKTIDYYEQIRT